MSVPKKLKILGICIIILAFSLALTGCLQAQKLPEPEINLASKVLDVNGKEITTLFKENREEVSLDEVSPYFRDAIVAIEDSRFYQHSGLDFTGIARAVVKNITEGKVVEGGSTITQQTVKNLYLTNARTFDRKLKELFLTVQLERRYTKNEILAMYINQIYFGKGAYGVEVASKTYFDKPAKDLNLAESAMLAGVPKAPNNYNPLSNFAAAKRRQQVVLNRMVELGKINQAEAETAKKQEISLKTSEDLKTQKASYFIDEVREYIIDKFPDGAELLYRGGLKIETSLDLEMQAAAEAAMAAGLKGDPEMQGALVAIEPKTGYVKAMVGGRDASSKFNRALAKRQPGSAMKPFLYTAAIDNGYTAASTFTCEPVEFKLPNGEVYKPTDYGSSYHNQDFTLKEALKISDNVVAVKLNQEVGPETLAKYANKMGIKSNLRPYLSLALGSSEVTPWELAVAYGPLANRGITAKPIMILRILDRNGKVLEENKPFLSKVVDEKTAYIVTDMLKSVVEPGGTAASVGEVFQRPMAGKTGTTNNSRDAWYVGYTPDLVTSVWVGYDEQSRSVGSSGGRLAAPIWINFNKVALENYQPKDFPIPEGIVKVKICADTGLLATSQSEKVIEAAFIKGTEPTEPCPNHPEPNWWERPFGNDEENNRGSNQDRGKVPKEIDRIRRNLMDWFF